MDQTDGALHLERTVRRHLILGWSCLLVFLSLGIALELMHGFKVRFYLDVSNETRRLMWRLAHAHGALFGLINVVFALSVKLAPGGDAAWRRAASFCLAGAALLLPGGFFLGGLLVYGADPWIGIVLVPLGALLGLVGILLTLRGMLAATSGDRA